jgi:DNA-binding transcriptional MerR regulator
LPELAQTVNAWCRENGLSPANGQAADDLSERSLRYYRTLGLLDPPQSGGGSGYGEIHLLQLLAIRLLQARGLPLRRIRELLHGRTPSELARIRDEGLREHLAGLPPKPGAHPPPMPEPAWNPPADPESWRMIPLTGDVLLLVRPEVFLSAETLAAVRHLLSLPSPS